MLAKLKLLYNHCLVANSFVLPALQSCSRNILSIYFPQSQISLFLHNGQ